MNYFNPFISESHILIDHKKQHNLETEDSLYCGLCNKTFDKTAQYQNHMRYHKAIRKFPCMHCSKSFSQSNNLRTHLRIHTNERPFKCIECGKAFTQVTNLNNHVRLHTGERPYVCTIPGCDKAFAQVTNLNNHRRSHQKDLPFACDRCYKAFPHEDQLLQHRYLHVDNSKNDLNQFPVLMCLACGESFKEERLLKKHVRESCKRSGNYGPEDNLSSAKKECFFGKCKHKFDNMSSLHHHLSKDHGMLINPLENKTRRYTSKTNKKIFGDDMKDDHIKSNCNIKVKPLFLPSQFHNLDQEVIKQESPDYLFMTKSGDSSTCTNKRNTSESEESTSSDNDCSNTRNNFDTNSFNIQQKIKLVCSKCFATFPDQFYLEQHMENEHK